MKKIYLSTLLIFILAVACGCAINNESGSGMSKYKSDAVAEGVYCFEDSTIGVYPYDNKFYQLNYVDENRDIGYYEPETMEYHYLCTIENDVLNDIYINDTGIYVAGEHVVYEVDFKGNIKEKIELPDLGAFDSMYRLAVNEKYTAVSCFYYLENARDWDNVIYVIDNTTNEITQYDYKKLKEGDTLENILPTNEENKFILVGNYQVYSFDATDGKTELLYDGVNSNRIDYSPTENCLYFIDQRMVSGERKMGKIQLPDGDITIARNTELEYIYRKIKSAVNREVNMIEFGDIYYTESGYMLWDQYNQVMFVKPEKVNDTGEEITVVYRYAPSTTVQLQSNYETEFGWMNGMMARMNTQFEEENKIVVNAKGYAYDKFVENLRVKLLAGDDDYDVVMLEHADELLASILNYGLYLPLETYDSISSGFDKYYDGVRDVMTYDGHIFGIPYYLAANGYVSEDDTLEKLGTDYTLDDFWNLCEEFGSQQILNSNNLTNHETFYSIISSIIEDGMRKGEISRDAILDCIESYSEYYKAGALVTGNGPFSIINGVGGNYESRFNEKQYKTLRSLPSYDGKNYIDIKSMAYINSKTKNADLAAEYMSIMVSDDYLPWCNQFDKSYLAKDADSYFTLTLGENPLETEYKKIKIPAAEDVYMNGISTFLVENGNEFFKNAAPRLYTYNLEEIITEVYNGVKNGTMTAEDAADKIYSEASYQLME